MKRDIRSLRVNRSKAIRLLALVGLAATGLSVLPDLLRTPEPPPLPPNIGFRPGEFAAFSPQPRPDTGRRKAGKRPGEQGAGARNRGKTQPKGQVRDRRSKAAGGKNTAGGKDTAGGKEGLPKAESRAGDATPAGEGTTPVPAAAAPAQPVPPVPADTLPPQPVPPPPVATTPAPDHPPDGSEEFAPR